jgi:predicted RNA-binding Zn ribbon-like protein
VDADIELLLEFLQTYSLPDAFASPESIRGWLTGHRLLDDSGPVADAELRRVIRLRAAMFDYFRGEGALDPRTAETIEAATAGAPLRMTVGAGREAGLAASGTGIDRALGELAAALYRASVTQDLSRLKSCKACGFAFYDVTKNRSRVWCEMALCGSQQKAKAYRKRQKAEAAGAQAGA